MYKQNRSKSIKKSYEIKKADFFIAFNKYVLIFLCIPCIMVAEKETDHFENNLENKIL